MVKTIENQLLLTCQSQEELTDIAKKILSFAGEEKVIAIEGQLGAGKTTLIQYLCKQMGVEDHVTSPSFSIINEYIDAQGEPVYHFDFYRIKGPEEAYQVGSEEYFYSGRYCFIEWPSKVTDLIPNDHISVKIEVTGTGSRTFEIAKHD